jgi:hypothetical protein
MNLGKTWVATQQLSCLAYGQVGSGNHFRSTYNCRVAETSANEDWLATSEVQNVSWTPVASFEA